jgi:Domain of unknown function (DUF4398)
MTTKRSLVGVLLFAASAAWGCGGAPPPTGKLADSEGALRAAHEVGAERVPAAALHLKLAEEEIAKAKAELAAEHNEIGALILLKAQGDAELALALAREAQAKAEAQAALDQVAKLRGGGAP